MHFCSECSNMYYINIEEDVNHTGSPELYYYCRNCGHVSTGAFDDNIVVLKTQLKKTEQDSAHIVNQYTKLDPTLPRVSNILCPNEACKTNASSSSSSSSSTSGTRASAQEHEHSAVPREIIFIRYDDRNMKYIYLCSTCDTVWKTSSLTNK